MTIVLKLGGSVLTDKSRPETIAASTLAQISQAVAHADSTDLVLVHGGGSFGHPPAERYNVSATVGSHDQEAIRDITEAMSRLNGHVLDAFHDDGVPAVRVPPIGMVTRHSDGSLELSERPTERLLAEGFVPVTHGDIVGHQGEGCSILSGDELVIELATALDADSVGFCSDVPGVLSADGTVIDQIDSIESVSDQLTGATATDVTGGMAEKVSVLLNASVPGVIFGVEGIGAFLNGETPGTYID